MLFGSIHLSGQVWQGSGSSTNTNFANTDLTVTADRIHELNANNVDFQNAAISLFYLDAVNNRVGINTKTPSQRFVALGTIHAGSHDISDNNYAYSAYRGGAGLISGGLKIRNGGTNMGTGIKITMTSSNFDNDIVSVLNADLTSADMYFTTTHNSIKSEKMRLSSDGNLTATGTITGSNLSGTNTGDDPLDLTQVNTWTGQQSFNDYQLTDAATITWDLNTAQVAFVTLAGSRTLANPTNMIGGGVYTITISQDNIGTRSLTFGTNYKFPGGIVPTVSLAGNAVDIMTCISDGTSMFCDLKKDYK
ncbi:MAG: hypothetical protein GXO85_02220 [Chlorobi bacterium]|nr:hypothetical protein [Chlorobiota bacterium]